MHVFAKINGPLASVFRQHRIATGNAVFLGSSVVENMILQNRKLIAMLQDSEEKHVQELYCLELERQLLTSDFRPETTPPDDPEGYVYAVTSDLWMLSKLDNGPGRKRSYLSVITPTMVKLV